MDQKLDPIEAILTTRAIRRFTDRPVSDDDLLTCLRAAQQAPTGGNVQPVQYVVVTDPAVKAELGRLYRTSYDRYEATLPEATFRNEADAASWARTRDASRHLAEHLGDAPAIVLFLLPIIPWGAKDDQGPLDIGPLYASCYPAVQNFCVAARTLGLGTALTTVIRVATTATLELLGVPADRYEIAALVPVGYPVGHFGRARRKPVEAVTHWDRWGNRRPLPTT